ncbi:MAG: penicillin-binding transpeptidase domain-containing protein [Corynebacterium sp.]|nr:penicillin-binding transpeptidase domain-containing protein [Corynebacterium sp.]MDO5029278.1 penicillin-binding transpeptidase domain-containing protein [Corynebacterium sp.]
MEHTSRRRPLARSISAVTIAGLVMSLAACTPRPDTGRDVLEEFLSALGSGDVARAAALTDHPESAEGDLQAAKSGLQEAGLDYEIDSIDSSGNQSSADVAMNWKLPHERHWNYDTTFTLTKTESGQKDWTLRWTPASLHPQLGRNQHPELRTIPATRPSVVGSDGAALLEPGTVHRVIVDRDAVVDVQSAINRAATVINNEMPEDGPKLDARKVGSEAIGGKGNYSLIVLPANTPDRVKDDLNNIDGITVNDEAAMVRPDPGFAPDLMSRVEKLVAEGDSGADGWNIVAANEDGAVVGTLFETSPNVAPAIQASISKKVQDAAQKAVDTRQDAKAMLVAIQPSSGKILAVAQTEEADKDGDLALMGQFPPGSTYKIITAAAGVQHQGLTASSTVPCPGSMEIGPRIVTNYNGSGVGDTSLSDAFARSCNTTFGNIAHQLKPGEFKEESQNFGIGINYHIAGLDTITGSVSDGENEVERIDAGYGQGHDLVSPFGMALVSATVAAGRTPTPSLVPSAGTWQSKVSQPIDPAVLDQVRQLMRAVVTSGTGTAIAGRGEVYAKTGEAEYSGGSHAWFTGYRDDLAFATLIVGGGGSEHAVAITDRFFANLDEGPAEDEGDAGAAE